MHSRQPIQVVGCHAEGEVGDVIVGGVPDVPGNSMLEKLQNFKKSHDNVRHLLLNEPRGRASLNLNLLVSPCDPKADMGLIIMCNDSYAFMSGSNVICATTVLLETSMLPMTEPQTTLTLDTAAGLVTVTAQCEAGKCKSVAFDGVPAFVAKLDFKVDVPGLGVVSVDIAWGGMWYGFVDARSLGLTVSNNHCRKLITAGDMVTRAIQSQFTPVHPDKPEMAGVCTVCITEEVTEEPACLTAKNTVIIPSSRLDRSPCGTATSARMAILNARGQLQVGQLFKHRSIIGTEFIGHVRRTTKVGVFDAIVPNVSGRGWITSHKQIVLDATDPYPEGFRVGDQWPVASDG
ncbi:Proline racemase [Metarhizium album ARSEF 1941]|uniref:Proline racemase n=1 Tax=Metarhizium album (strain ARSEF 1941) TaxID=1081103 RepID=A0A0B2WY51_METAS|nr:Proline racemase [Metarhizium album ARSEF 1941]KHN98529.1 Proline racemase [Metarhizium album ARSEF 1941]